VIRRLKAELAGEIQVGGPVLAQSLTEAGLIDEYRLYLHPVVLGGGQPFFAGPRPPLHLVAEDRMELVDSVTAVAQTPQRVCSCVQRVERGVYVGGPTAIGWAAFTT
jgi:riboflavin biosynthesis pyrimidine reductase